MSEDWGEIVKRYRLRHGLTQSCLAGMIGVSQRTVSRWERGEDKPSLGLQRHLRDLARDPPGSLVVNLAQAVRHCPFPRALSRTPRLRLQALSGPAIRKRPSIVNWIGKDLAPIATGILREMLDDRMLQRSIARREVACIVATTRSVLQTREHARIGTYRTVITYFFHEGTFYSDAISTLAPAGSPLGYRAISLDEALDER